MLNKLKGRLLFTYSKGDKYFHLFQSSEVKSLFIYVTEGLSRIESKVPISNSELFYRTDVKIHWYKPVIRKDDTLEIKGRVTTNGDTKHFTIDSYTGELICSEPLKEQTEFSYNLVTALDGLKIIHGLQRDDRLYFVALVTDADVDDEHVFGEVDLGMDQLERFYYLYTDKGSIYPTSIDISESSSRVTISGGMVNNTTGEVNPYIETFRYSN